MYGCWKMLSTELQYVQLKIVPILYKLFICELLYAFQCKSQWHYQLLYSIS